MNMSSICPGTKSLFLCLVVIFLSGLGSVASAADVLISRLDDSPDPVPRGGEVTYGIAVENQADDTALNVVLTFPVPTDTEFVSLDNPGECSHNGGTPGIITCTYGDLLGTALIPPGPIKNVNVVLRAIGNTYLASASVATDSADTDTGNNSETQNTTVNNGADLTVTLTGTPNPVIAGGDVTYTSTVTNNGPNDAVNNQVVYVLSTNMSYVNGSVSGAGWNCTYSSGDHSLTCDLSGDLTSGSSAGEISFKAQVTGVSSGTVTTTATVSSDTLDPLPNNNVVTEDVAVSVGTDVAVTITASPSSVIEGNDVLITLQPRNLGPVDAETVEVKYTVPAGFTINGAPSGNGWTCGVNLQVVTCSRANYIVGSTDDITIDLTSPVYSRTTTFDNPVTITTTTPEAPERLANNSDTTPITLLQNGVDLEISKTKSPNPVAQGSQITSVIRITNNGPLNAPAGSITVTDVLDVTNEDYVSASGTNWTCNWSSPEITCVYNAVLNNGDQTSAITILTTATSAMTLTNTGSISYSGSPGDYNSSNNTVGVSVESTTVVADLAVTKTADAGNADGDTGALAVDEDTITYTITIENRDDAAYPARGPATGIILTDPIAGYVTGSTVVTVTASPANYTCTTGATVICTQDSGSLTVGATDSFTITVSRPLFDGVRTNTASAYSADVGDPNRSNNLDSATVTVNPIADLEVQSKTVTPNPVKAGVEATYVISVKNNGPSTAAGVSVTDTFDLTAGNTGFTFISAVSSSGSCSGLTAGASYTAADSPELTCTLGDIPYNGTRTITLLVRPNFMSAPPDPRIIDNSVTATTTTHDNNAANNSFGPVTLTVVQDLLDLLINNNDSPDPLPHDPANGGDNAGNDVVYHISYENNGPSYASGVTFDFTMTPKNNKTVDFQCDEAAAGDSCGTSADNCTVTGGSDPVTGPSTLKLTCTAGNLAAGDTGKRYLTFRIISEPDSTGDTHVANATIRANEREDELGNNSEGENTSVRGKVDLVVTKSPSPGTVDITEPFDWNITVTNNGPSNSRNTILTDTLPQDMILFGAAPSWINANDGTNGGCTNNGQTMECDFGTVSNGAQVVLTVPVLINVRHGASMENCATAVTDDVDTVPGNNTGICGTINVNSTYLSSDYGDAPDNASGTGVANYQTILLDQGARHIFNVGANPYFGHCVDADGNGTQQNNAADIDDVTAGFGASTNVIGTCTGDDDEDGIVLPILVAGRTADIQITVGGFDCRVDAWIDYNADGDWTDAGEQIITNKAFSVGNTTETISVPQNFTVGDSYARFRCSSAGGLAPTGSANDGEVEDYKVSLQPDYAAKYVDYGDAGGSYKTTLAQDGASHILGVPGAAYLGNCADSDDGTLENASADADDLAPQGGTSGGTTIGTCTTAGDDEDGITFPDMIAGENANLSVTVSGASCRLNAWIDYNADGDWSDSGEQIVTDQILPVGTSPVTIAIPQTIAIGQSYARFRCSSGGGLHPFGAAPDGEVEDYRIPLLGFLSGQVRLDTDNDGDIADPDSGINRVHITLYDDGGNLLATTTTDGSGNYRFTGLSAGSYVVVESDPVGHTSTADIDGPNDNRIATTLNNGGSSTGNDFLDAILGSIGNIVWDDSNGDGLQNNGESGHQGISVHLLDGNDTPVDNPYHQGMPYILQTGTAGEYLFENLPVGTYQIQFILPNNNSFTSRDSGGDDTVDSDPDPATGKVTVVLAAGETNLTVDAGLIGAAVELEKSTNTMDADTAPGVLLNQGDTITWRYVVTNTGTVNLTDVAVTDDQIGSISCPQDSLTVGSSMTCTATGTAVAGQYKNIGFVVGTPPDGPAVVDSDPSHYLARNTGAAAIDLEKATNGEDADNGTGPIISSGHTVTWTYRVQNIGNVQLTNIMVSDDQVGAITCPQDTLNSGDSMTCTATGTAVVGQYKNIGSVMGKPPVGPDVTDQDPSHYLAPETGTHFAGIDLEKETNAQDADTAPGVYAEFGHEVTWTYRVTNSGGVVLNNVTVTDDQVPDSDIHCSGDGNTDHRITILPVGSSVTCTATGTALAGQYVNTGSVIGSPPEGPNVTDTDPSHYFGDTGSIDIEKATNGLDADNKPGPEIYIKKEVIWTYVVTNTGQFPLEAVTVTDDQRVTVSCPRQTLNVAESMTCTGRGTAVEGQYVNIGSVTATTPHSEIVADSDPSHYFGKRFNWTLFQHIFASGCPPVPDYCYLVADGDNQTSENSSLFTYTFKTDKLELIGRLGVDNVETIVLSLDGKTLYATDNGVFGIIQSTADMTDMFIPIDPSGVGSGRGALGTIELKDIDGLAFDPITGILYGTVRHGDGLPDQLDLLIQITPATGKVVTDAFGTGVDYVVIATAAIGASDVDDIAIDSDGTLFGVVGNSGGGGNDHLVIIDKQTGAVRDYGPLHDHGAPIQDMEGLTLYNTKVLYGTTGYEFSELGTDNTLYRIDKQTGTADAITNLEQDFDGYIPRDFEAISCFPICK